MPNGDIVNKNLPYAPHVYVGIIMHQLVPKSRHIAEVHLAMLFAELIGHVVCRFAKYDQMIQYQFCSTVALNKVDPCYSC